jgi:hypothetical protein
VCVCVCVCPHGEASPASDAAQLPHTHARTHARTHTDTGTDRYRQTDRHRFNWGVGSTTQAPRLQACYRHRRVAGVLQQVAARPCVCVCVCVHHQEPRQQARACVCTGGRGRTIEGHGHRHRHRREEGRERPRVAAPYHPPGPPLVSLVGVAPVSLSLSLSLSWGRRSRRRRPRAMPCAHGKADGACAHEGCMHAWGREGCFGGWVGGLAEGGREGGRRGTGEANQGAAAAAGRSRRAGLLPPHMPPVTHAICPEHVRACAREGASSKQSHARPPARTHARRHAGTRTRRRHLEEWCQSCQGSS